MKMLVPIILTAATVLVAAAPQNYGANIPSSDMSMNQYGGFKALPLPLDSVKNAYGGDLVQGGDDTDGAYGGQQPFRSGGSDSVRITDRRDFSNNFYGGAKPSDPILPFNPYGGLNPLPPSEDPKVPSGNNYGAPEASENNYGWFQPSDPIRSEMPSGNSYGGADRISDPVMSDNPYGGFQPIPEPLPDVPKGSSYGSKRPADPVEKPSNPYGGFHPFPPKDTLPVAPNSYGGRSGDMIKKSANPYS